MVTFEPAIFGLFSEDIVQMTYPICAYYVNWLKEINKSFSGHWVPVGLFVLIGSLFCCQLQKAGNPF